MTISPRPQAPSDLMVDGYTLLTRIGEGGMGVVHLARQPGGERVALKVLRPHIVGDDEARARLAREVNSLSRIRSPRIAEIVDADPWGPVPFVATRYVPGLSLHDHIHEEGPITGADLTWFADCLAEAVMAVHACGVLHRDIKPSNVLMEGRSPVLIDFGLARVADDPKLTHTGWLLGTPGYLAPEILYGEDASAASDVHSWGATVAFAGTGRGPFGRGPSMAIMDRVRRGEYDIEGLPTQLREIVADALEPNPALRPTLATIRQALSGVAQVRETEDAATVVRDVDPYTVPLALAALAHADRTTDNLRPPPTLVVTGFEPESALAPRSVGTAVKARRASLITAGALACGAAVAAYPYLGTLGLLVVAWLLRSASLAVAAAGDRRKIRGQRWYDGPQVLLAAPWHLVQSIPGTVMLVLWAGGLALAGALLGYAGSLTWPQILFIAGGFLSGALWLGPGGSRVRGPLNRVVRPVADTVPLWAASLLVVLAIGAGLGGLVVSQDVNWAPADQGPLVGDGPFN